MGDVRLDDYGELGPQEATRLLRNYAGDVVKLILVPAAPVAQRGGASSAGSRRNLHHLPPTPPPASPRPSQCSTLTGLRNRLNSAGSRSPHHALYQVHIVCVCISTRNPMQFLSNRIFFHKISQSGNLVRHSFSCNTILQFRERSIFMNFHASLKGADES